MSNLQHPLLGIVRSGEGLDNRLSRLRRMARDEWMAVWETTASTQSPESHFNSLIATLKARVKIGERAVELLTQHERSFAAAPPLFYDLAKSLDSDVRDSSTTNIDKLAEELEAAP